METDVCFYCLMIMFALAGVLEEEEYGIEFVPPGKEAGGACGGPRSSKRVGLRLSVCMVYDIVSYNMLYDIVRYMVCMSLGTILAHRY